MWNVKRFLSGRLRFPADGPQESGLVVNPLLVSERTMEMPQKTAPQKSNKPVHEIRRGRIKAAIWENETANGTRHNVTFIRLWKDDAGNWQDSPSFGRDDLLLLGKVADLVHTWILDQGSASSGNGDEGAY